MNSQSELPILMKDTLDGESPLFSCQTLRQKRINWVAFISIGQGIIQLSFVLGYFVLRPIYYGETQPDEDLGYLAAAVLLYLFLALCINWLIIEGFKPVPSHVAFTKTGLILYKMGVVEVYDWHEFETDVIMKGKGRHNKLILRRNQKDSPRKVCIFGIPAIQSAYQICLNRIK